MGPEKNFLATDWDEAFSFLDKEISLVEKKRTSKRLIVFFDEFQWLCEMKPNLVSIFKYHWDNFLSKHRNCIFVICGSVSSFIVRKVVQSKALYGRVNLEIDLKKLSLIESRQFFKKDVHYEQILDSYLVFGGIPQYLIELNPKMSLIQNLNEYAFKPQGFFFKEFERLFISHFARHKIYEKILKVLSLVPRSSKDLAQKCNTSSGGSFTEHVKELELAGFVEKQISVDQGTMAKVWQSHIEEE